MLYCVQVARRKHCSMWLQGEEQEDLEGGEGTKCRHRLAPSAEPGEMVQHGLSPPPPALERPCLHPCSASVLMLSISICWVDKCNVPCGALLRSLFLFEAPKEPFWQAWWAVSCAVGLTLAKHWNREVVESLSLEVFKKHADMALRDAG